MITPDAHSRVLATGPDAEIDAFLDAAAAGRADDSASALDEAFVRSVGEILQAAAGSVDVTLAGPLSFSTHHFTLARGGTLRRSQGQSPTAEISALPTEALPGALLRLVSIAPVETLPAEVTLELPPGTLEDLFTADSEARTTAWSTVIEAARALPPAEQSHLERAEPRAAQLVRHRPESDRTSRIILLRGRYLVPAEDGPDTLRGASSTEATRTLLTGMLRPVA